MKLTARSLGLIAIVVVAGCGNNGSGGGSSTGGTISTGGQAPSGGSSGSGGSSASGGATGSGGTLASGGSTATGGRTGTGGTTSTGGATASGGSSATGGSSAKGGTGAGGTTASGGSSATGGSSARGGATGTGGTAAGGTGAGGTAAGGATGSGGTGASDGGPGDARDGSPDYQKLDMVSDLPKEGSDTGGGYQPCPTNGDPCKILPLGDSITWGYGAEPGYRTELFTKIVNAQQTITFTGSLSNGPATVAGQTFPKKNEGHSGWRIATANSSSGNTAGIAALIPSPAMDSGNGGVPHIILLHIGTNDVWDMTGANMATQLGALIDKLITAAPNALLVVAKLTPLNANPQSLKDYNNAIPGLVQTRATAGKHIILGDMNTGFPSGGMASDGIHPNQAGYNWMGDQWYALISSYLPK